MSEPQDLTALLCSRLCHDLISPLGAIANGVELLLMSGAKPTPEVALIAESIAVANARIRFFRVAFGSAGPDQRLGKPEIAAILSDTLAGNRLSCDWQIAGDVARIEVKLAFLALLCCESAMPAGGKVTVQRSGGRCFLQAKAAKLRLVPDLWDGIRQPLAVSRVGATEVHFALLSAELTRQGRVPDLHLSSTDILLSF